MKALHPGRATGSVVTLDAPLSFWGGTDLAGHIRDAHHPQHGMPLTGRVVAMRASRGSSSSSSVLAEQIRLGTAPAGILLTERDPIILLGAIVAAELYGRSLPIALIEPAELAALKDGAEVMLAVSDGGDGAPASLELLP